VRIFAAEISTTEFLLLSFFRYPAVKNPAWLREHEMKNAILYHRVVLERHLNIFLKMYKILKRSIVEVPKDRRVPRLLGDILTKMLHSDSPLAKGYRKFLASKEKSAGKGDEQ
jgi:hypothetical protein